jgi:hypothetical protein
MYGTEAQSLIAHARSGNFVDTTLETIDNCSICTTLEHDQSLLVASGSNKVPLMSRLQMLRWEHQWIVLFERDHGSGYDENIVSLASVPAYM